LQGTCSPAFALTLPLRAHSHRLPMQLDSSGSFFRPGNVQTRGWTSARWRYSRAARWRSSARASSRFWPRDDGALTGQGTRPSAWSSTRTRSGSG
jgi:hypothetical protein